MNKRFPPRKCSCGSQKIYPFGLEKFKCKNCERIFQKDLNLDEMKKKIQEGEILTNAIEKICEKY